MTEPGATPPRLGPPMPELRTERLILRDWRGTDLEPFAELNADPIAMEHFPSTLTISESAQMMDRLRVRWATHRLSWWAVESSDSGDFVGAVGLMLVDFDAPFNDADNPSIEVGWRLRRSAWGHGFATEAALAALDWCFSTCEPDEILAFTAVDNRRSRRVMDRIGMAHDPGGDFDHPRVPPGHRLERHVLYRLPRPFPQ